MSKTIHIWLPGSTRDSGFNESDHPRADNGQFGKGSGGGKSTGKASGPGGAAERAQAKGTKPAARKPAVNMHSLKEGQALYDSSGKKVDEIESISKKGLGSNWTLHTRAGYEVHVDSKTGSNAKGWSNEKPAEVK